MRRLSNLPLNLPRWPMIGLFLCVGFIAGCRFDMSDQPRYEPLEASTFFADGASARPRVADTVARGQLPENEQLTTGRVNGQVADSFPFTVTVDLIERGQERYDIFCKPCHGLVGDGQGIVTDYGMPKPTSFHDPDLRAESTGYYFTVITGGTRIMPPYGSRIPPTDRWAIIAYIRALQLSQNATAPADAQASTPVTNTETSTVTSPVTSTVTNTATSPVTSPVTSTVTNTATSPVTSTATSPVTSTETITND